MNELLPEIFGNGNSFLFQSRFYIVHKAIMIKFNCNKWMLTIFSFPAEILLIVAIVPR